MLILPKDKSKDMFKSGWRPGTIKHGSQRKMNFQEKDHQNK